MKINMHQIFIHNIFLSDTWTKESDQICHFVSNDAFPALSGVASLDD